ncbi:MAG: hypothetical protein ABIF40_05295 [archaeon]
MIEIPKDFPWKVAQEEINGRQINLIGVWHHETYLPEFGNFLTHCIEQSDMLIMECNVSLLDDPMMIKSGTNFFKYLAERANENDKDIWSIDPIYQNSTREFVITMGKILGGGLLFSHARIEMQPKRSLHHWNKIEKPSRRKLLGLLGLAGLGIGTSVHGFGDTFYPSGVRGLFQQDLEDLSTFGTDDIITHDPCDYRNIKIAQGLDKLIEYSEEGSEIVMIAGEAHVLPSLHYLTHPVIRQLKAQTYPENLIYDTSLRKYSFDNNDWVESERIKN